MSFQLKQAGKNPPSVEQINQSAYGIAAYLVEKYCDGIFSLPQEELDEFMDKHPQIAIGMFIEKNTKQMCMATTPEGMLELQRRAMKVTGTTIDGQLIN